MTAPRVVWYCNKCEKFILWEHHLKIHSEQYPEHIVIKYKGDPKNFK